MFWDELRKRRPDSDVLSVKVGIYQRLYHSARRDDRAALLFAFAAAADLAAQPVRSPKDIALVAAPRWVIEGIGAAWLRFVSSPDEVNGRLDVAFGRNAAQGSRGLNERYEIDRRDMHIAMDVATRLRFSQPSGLAHAAQYLAGIYDGIEEDTIAKAWQRYQADAEFIIAEELAHHSASRASRSE